ncbi:hypothetical protein ACOSOMT5_P2936 [Acidiphilium sp. MT5]
MPLSVRIRQQAKIVLRPLARPLLYRLHLPFDLLLPRIEQLEQRLNTTQPPTASLIPVQSIQAIQGTVRNLTRSWMRQQQEMASFSAMTEKRLAEIEQRTAAIGETRLVVPPYVV